jgi:DNA invertase Pin-like site-specific DNA recombinase
LVLFWSLDRFSREGVLETLQHLQKLTAYGVGWKSFTEQYLDSCGVFRHAVLSILATIAKQQRNRLSERTIAGPGTFAKARPHRRAPASGDQPAESNGSPRGRQITARDRNRDALEPDHGCQDRAGSRSLK